MHRERACQSSPEPSGREEALRAFSRECHPQTGEPCWGGPWRTGAGGERWKAGGPLGINTEVP